MTGTNPPPVRLADYQPTDFAIDTVTMTVRLDEKLTTVAARYDMRRRDGVGASTVRLHADNLDDVQFAIDGNRVDAARDGSDYVLTVPSRDQFSIDVETGLDPDTNTALSGLYRTNGVYCTQCEAEGFRRIIPFLDRPDVLSRYRVRLEARRDQCPVLLANGNLMLEEDLEDGWHAAVWDDPHPKPSYLFAMVGGKLDALKDSFTTMEGRKVALGLYVEAGKTDRAGFAMEALKRSMRWDEERFGRAYDLDQFNIVAVSDFNLGAMENKGLNIFNDKYILASPDTATDQDYERIEAIIAHEYFHNWSGNRITCRDWFQLCLKEGLTVFRDQEYTSDLYDRVIKRIDDVRTLRAQQFPEDAGPLAHAVRPDTYREINNFYTATVYEKGAEIVRMISRWLGPDRFRAAMDRYFVDYDGQAVRLEDFLAAMETERPEGEQWPDFLSWYTQAGTPRVQVSFAEGANGAATLSLRQETSPTAGQDTKIPLPIPCEIGLVDAFGRDVPLDPSKVHCEGGRCKGSQFLLEEETGSITLSGLPEGTLRPSLFRDFSAPVIVDFDGLTPADELALARQDPNAFNAWAHIQSSYTHALQRRYHRLSINEPVGHDGDLFAVMIEHAKRAVTDQSRWGTAAAALTLPTAHDLARTLERDINPDLVERARDSLRDDLCAQHGEHLVKLADTLGLEDSADISPKAANKRALLTALFSLVATWDHDIAADRLAQLRDGAKGMTMRLAALQMLVRRGGPGADAALSAFEARHGGDPLAMDKWLAVQARLCDAPVLAKLEAHRDYDASNPNRVRSLIGSFAMGNLSGFHAADGAGYRFVSERIARIDRDNPQLAARLAAAFGAWRTLEPLRRDQAHQALLALEGSNGLSVDLSDILTRTIAS
ncbi:MAG: aminopeptidase N [Pseudomonadota bacterium]